MNLRKYKHPGQLLLSVTAFLLLAAHAWSQSGSAATVTTLDTGQIVQAIAIHDKLQTLTNGATPVTICNAGAGGTANFRRRIKARRDEPIPGSHFNGRPAVVNPRRQRASSLNRRPHRSPNSSRPQAAKSSSSSRRLSCANSPRN